VRFMGTSRGARALGFWRIDGSIDEFAAVWGDHDATSRRRHKTAPFEFG